ncbi:MAG: cytochrome P450 [Nakamurella sp.]
MTENTSVADTTAVDPFMFLQRQGLDPVKELPAMAASGPVHELQFPFGITAWLVTGYDAAKTVLGDTAAFSNDFAYLTSMAADGLDGKQNPGGLGMSDPPEHTRLRKMLTPEFTMRRLNRLAPRVTAIVDELLDNMAESGSPVDFVESFAMPLPSLVICELLDVPYPDREAFTKFSSSRFDIFGGAGSGLDAVGESLAYMGELVTMQRAHPGDGLLGGLIRTYGDALDDRELAGLADGILVGGHETTASMLALGAMVLMSNAQFADAMRGGDDVAVHQAVEELLRYLSVVQVAFPRFARKDIEVCGKQIHAGQMVLCSLSAANRDPVLGGDPERFDTHREPGPNLAFGYGIHRCIGSELARMELRTAYPALLRRFPGLQLSVPLGDIAFREYSIVYGVDSLPVGW